MDDCKLLTVTVSVEHLQIWVDISQQAHPVFVSSKPHLMRRELKAEENGRLSSRKTMQMDFNDAQSVSSLNENG